MLLIGKAMGRSIMISNHVRQCARIQHSRWVLKLLQSYRPKIRRGGVWILTKKIGPRR